MRAGRRPHQPPLPAPRWLPLPLPRPHSLARRLRKVTASSSRASSPRCVLLSRGQARPGWMGCLRGHPLHLPPPKPRRPLAVHALPRAFACLPGGGARRSSVGVSRGVGCSDPPYLRTCRAHVSLTHKRTSARQRQTRSSSTGVFGAAVGRCVCALMLVRNRAGSARDRTSVAPIAVCSRWSMWLKHRRVGGWRLSSALTNSFTTAAHHVCKR